MLRPGTRLSRGIVAFTAAVAAVAVGVFVASPAHAEPFAGVVESFDNVPDDRWDIDAVSGQGSVSMGPTLFALTLPNAAMLDASSYGNSLAKITRTFNPDSDPRFTVCRISLFVRRVAVRNEPFPVVQVTMRMRQGGPNGLITMAKGLTVGDTLRFTHWVFADSISYPTSQRTIEIGALRGIAVVDDLRITCGTR